MTFNREKWRAELLAESFTGTVGIRKALEIAERAYAEGRADTLQAEMDAHDIGDEDREAWRTGTEFFDNEDLTTYRCENYDRIAALLAAARKGTP